MTCFFCSKGEEMRLKYHFIYLEKLTLLPSLCGATTETRDHLFFVCEFSRDVWNNVRSKCNHHVYCNNWEEIHEILVNAYGRELWTTRE